MAKTDIPIWTFAGVFLGMITSALVNQSYVLLGALAGGIIGYMLGRAFR